MKTKRIFTLLLLLGAMVTGISAQSTIPIKKEKPKSQGNNARIVVRSGGKLNVTNGAVINSRDERSFVISKGGRLKISNGKIK